MHFHQELAGVAAGVEQAEVVDRVLEPHAHVLARLDLARGDPAAELAEHLVVVLDEVEDDEALHGEALHQDQRPGARARRRLLVIVARDHAAERHAAEQVHAAHHRLHDRAADLLEVDVHALRRQRVEPLADVLVLVVDRRVEAELVGKIAALLRAAGDADDMQALDLADLADDLPDAAGGRRDDQRLAFLRLADVQQAEIGRRADEAEDAVADRERQARRQLGLCEVRAVGDDVVGELAEPEIDVAFLHARLPARHDAAGDAAAHRRVERHRRHVLPHVAHPDAIGRIEREIQHLEQKLAVLQLGKRLALVGEVALLDVADRALAQAPDVAVRCHRLLLFASTGRGCLMPPRCPRRP